MIMETPSSSLHKHLVTVVCNSGDDQSAVRKQHGIYDISSVLTSKELLYYIYCVFFWSNYPEDPLTMYFATMVEVAELFAIPYLNIEYIHL